MDDEHKRIKREKIKKNSIIFGFLILIMFASVSSELWKRNDVNTITPVRFNDSILLNRDILLYYNSSYLNTTGTGSTTVDINYTFNSTTETTEADFTRGSLNNTDRITQSGNIILSVGNTTGNYTSMVFDLGQYPNMSIISWGHDTPKLAYYFSDNLTFYWDGAVNYSYINQSLQGTLSGATVVGSNGSIFPDNNATYFDGVAGGINFGTVSFLTNTSYAINFWAKLTANQTSPNPRRMIAGAVNSFRIEIDITNKLYFLDTDAGVSMTYAQSLAGWGNWHMYTATLDANNRARAYIDGIEVASDGTVIMNPKLVTTFRFARAGGASNNFTGFIDEVAVWNRNMSAGEINALYNISAGIKYPIVLQTRSDNINVGWANWTNTTKENGYYSNSTGMNINRTGLNFDLRYFQYRALLETLNASYTPILNWVNFSYISNSTSITTTYPTSEWIAQSNQSRIYSIFGEIWHSAKSIFTGGIKLQSNTTVEICNVNNEGAIYYDGGSKKHLACNSSGWQELY